MTDGQVYVLGDYTVHETPNKWAEAVITAFHRHEANMIVGEVNNGGDLVERNIKAVDAKIPFKASMLQGGKLSGQNLLVHSVSRERFTISVLSLSLKIRCVNGFHD